MAELPTVSVDVSLQATGISRAGFGTGLFIDSHRWFSERVRTYTSLESAAQDIPTDSVAYAALIAAFSQTPKPQAFKIGRREADSILDPSVPATGDVYTVVVEVNDGDSVTVSYTAVALDTEEDVVDGLKAAIDGDANVAAHVTTTKNGTGAATTLTISATTSADYFVLSGLSNNITTTFTSSETAAQVLAAIELVDTDFYGVMASDHTETFVLAMAGLIDARDKLYFVSSQETATLTAYTGSSTDILAQLAQAQNPNTITFFYHTADTTFPEVRYFVKNAPFDPGKVDYTNLQLGIAPSENPTTGNVLSATERGYLVDRNASYVVNDRGVNIVRGGLTVKGENIDDVRSVHFLKARLEEDLAFLLFNQAGTKIGYNNKGINKIRTVCYTTTTPMLSTAAVPNMLEEIEFFFTRAEDAAPADRQAGIVRGTFQGTLTGAVRNIFITGTLSYSLS